MGSIFKCILLLENILRINCLIFLLRFLNKSSLNANV